MIMKWKHAEFASLNISMRYEYLILQNTADSYDIKESFLILHYFKSESNEF